jgi:hypothetical protein
MVAPYGYDFWLIANSTSAQQIEQKEDRKIMRNLIAVALLASSIVHAADQNVGPANFRCPETLKSDSMIDIEATRFIIWATRTYGKQLNKEQVLDLMLDALKQNGCQLTARDSKSAARTAKPARKETPEDAALRKYDADLYKYITSFQSAKTLNEIQRFKDIYASNDPDNLIPLLADREVAARQAKKDDEDSSAKANQWELFSKAKTVQSLESFIEKYKNNDIANLVPDAQTKLNELLAIEHRSRKENPNAWACKPNTLVRFNGGWISGAGGNGFIDPILTLERFLSKPEGEKERIANENPLTVRFNVIGGGDGCTGVAYFEPRQVRITEPQGGGKIQGGKYMVVATELKTQRGLNAVCLIVVQSKNLDCR